MVKLIIHFSVIVLLTLLTQIGGLLYLMVLLIAKRFVLSRVKFIGLLSVIYLVATFLIVPLVAPIFGRTALPLRGELRPLNVITNLLNRHYVRPLLKEQLTEVADQMNAKYPGTFTNYLDANFPFISGFPLLPHLSHNDGRKVDLAFYYLDAATGEQVDAAPSLIGYGIYDNPKGNEFDYSSKCSTQGFWQYGFLGYLVPHWSEHDYVVDQERTQVLVQLLVKHQYTAKVFIEPHLKKRWGLSGLDKIRFHGCQAVRHDDHIHTQIR
jgi:hypothetical protein